VSDRVRSFVVVLDRDVSVDVAAQIAGAIAEMRQVQEVSIGPTITNETRRLRAMARGRLQDDLLGVLTPSWTKRDDR